MGSNFVFQMLPITRNIESILEELLDEQNPWHLSDVFRFIFVAVAVCLGTLITNFGQILAIVGLLGFGFFGMAFPVLCSLKIRGGKGNLTVLEIIQHALVLAVGVSTMSVGFKAVLNGGAQMMK